MAGYESTPAGSQTALKDPDDGVEDDVRPPRMRERCPAEHSLLLSVCVRVGLYVTCKDSRKSSATGPAQVDGERIVRRTTLHLVPFLFATALLTYLDRGALAFAAPALNKVQCCAARGVECSVKEDSSCRFVDARWW